MIVSAPNQSNTFFIILIWESSVIIMGSFNHELMDIVCKSRKHLSKTWIQSHKIKFTTGKMSNRQFWQFSPCAHSTVKFCTLVIWYDRKHIQRMLHAFWCLKIDICSDIIESKLWNWACELSKVTFFPFDCAHWGITWRISLIFTQKVAGKFTYIRVKLHLSTPHG